MFVICRLFFVFIIKLLGVGPAQVRFVVALSNDYHCVPATPFCNLCGHFFFWARL